MTFDEYKKREWRVIENEPDAKCTKGEIVSIDGRADGQVTKVNIRCNGSERYGAGKFEVPKGDALEGTIVGPDYVISMRMATHRTRQITLTMDSIQIAGSWTAEDTGSGGGDDV